MKNKKFRIVLAMVLVLIMAFSAIPLSATDYHAVYGNGFDNANNGEYEWTILVSPNMAYSYGSNITYQNLYVVYCWAETLYYFQDSTQYNQTWVTIWDEGNCAGVNFTLV